MLFIMQRLSEMCELVFVSVVVISGIMFRMKVKDVIRMGRKWVRVVLIVAWVMFLFLIRWVSCVILMIRMVFLVPSVISSIRLIWV